MTDFIFKCALGDGWPFFWFCLFIFGAVGLVFMFIYWLAGKAADHERGRFTLEYATHLANCARCGKEHARDNSLFCSPECERLNYEVSTSAPITNGCPCLLTTPCSDQCTCANPVMSGGCKRCCKYGSAEQWRQMAEHLATAVDVSTTDGHRFKGHNQPKEGQNEHENTLPS